MPALSVKALVHFRIFTAALEALHQPNQTHATGSARHNGDALNLGGRQSHVQSKLFMDSMIICCVQAAGMEGNPADRNKAG